MRPAPVPGRAAGRHLPAGAGHVRHQIGALGCRSPRPGPCRRRPAGRWPAPRWSRRPPGPGARRGRHSVPRPAGSSMRTSTVSPSRSAARWAMSSSARSARSSTRRATSSAGQLPGQGSPPRCRPRRSSRRCRWRRAGRRTGSCCSSATSSSVSPGKPTMKLDRTPASGHACLIWSSKRAELLAVAEPPHRAQHPAAGVLEGQVEVRGDALGGRHHLDQARAAARLAADSSPGPARSPAPRQAAAARPPGASGRPGPCRRRWSSR